MLICSNEKAALPGNAWNEMHMKGTCFLMIWPQTYSPRKARNVWEGDEISCQITLLSLSMPSVPHGPNAYIAAHPNMTDTSRRHRLAAGLSSLQRSIAMSTFGSCLNHWHKRGRVECSRMCTDLSRLFAPHWLQHCTIQAQLERCPVEHFSLVRVARDQPIHLHHLELADPMTTSLSLKVILRIPVGVVDYHHISRCQVDTQTTSFGTQ